MDWSEVDQLLQVKVHSEREIPLEKFTKTDEDELILIDQYNALKPKSASQQMFKCSLHYKVNNKVF